MRVFPRSRDCAPGLRHLNVTSTSSKSIWPRHLPFSTCKQISNASLGTTPDLVMVIQASFLLPEAAYRQLLAVRVHLFEVAVDDDVLAATCFASADSGPAWAASTARMPRYCPSKRLFFEEASALILSSLSSSALRAPCSLSAGSSECTLGRVIYGLPYRRPMCFMLSVKRQYATLWPWILTSKRR